MVSRARQAPPLRVLWRTEWVVACVRACVRVWWWRTKAVHVDEGHDAGERRAADGAATHHRQSSSLRCAGGARERRVGAIDAARRVQNHAVDCPLAVRPAS